MALPVLNYSTCLAVLGTESASLGSSCFAVFHFDAFFCFHAPYLPPVCQNLFASVAWPGFNPAFHGACSISARLGLSEVIVKQCGPRSLDSVKSTVQVQGGKENIKKKKIIIDSS